jgi:CRISPR-associated endonuclease/helicase Cas3
LSEEAGNSTQSQARTVGSRQTWFRQQFDWLTAHSPYLWQDRAFEAFVDNQIPSAFSLPTGSGKTSLIPIWLLSLLYQQQSLGRIVAPRRLVWVINRRAVVDQATEIAERIAAKFAEPCELRSVLDSISVSGGLGISTLRGEHEDNQEWSEDPSKPAIVIGTVDMVGSRLLFAGYGLSSRQRAQDAALIGNDVLLINDEAQLSPAFARLIRLIEQARKRTDVAPLKPFYALQVSATLSDPSTADGLFQFDMDSEPSKNFQKVYKAKKTLHLREVTANKNSEIVELAVRGRANRTTVMVDTPANARRIAEAICKATKSDRVLTMTGTMRGYERDALTKNPLFACFTSANAIPDERVWLVCTSAGESGIDMSCDLMITDLVPAERLIQRFGRLNRFGETSGEAVVVYSGEDVESDRGAATLRYLKGLHGDISCQMLSKNPAPPEACSARAGFARLHERDLQLLSYTSIRHSRLKPTVDPFLHGDEKEQPYTEVAWRGEIDHLLQASPEDRDAWLNVVRIKSHEKLRERTHIVLDLIKASGQSERIIVREADGDVSLFPEVRDFPNALLILPPGVLGLSNGMLAPENLGAPFDVADEGLRFVRDGDRFFQLGTEASISEEQFNELLKRTKMSVRLSITIGEDSELIYVQTKPERAVVTENTYLDDHLFVVEQNVRRLASALSLPGDLIPLIVQAAASHDTGKTHPNWQRAFGNNGGRNIAKLAKGTRTIQRGILRGLRHEFVSLLEANGEDPLALQIIASHHRWGRPHFPERGYDMRRPNEECRQLNLASMRRFAALQEKFGIWGLAYFESILRAADAQATV